MDLCYRSSREYIKRYRPQNSRHTKYTFFQPLMNNVWPISTINWLLKQSTAFKTIPQNIMNNWQQLFNSLHLFSSIWPRVGWFKSIGFNHWFKPWFKPLKKTMVYLVLMFFLFFLVFITFSFKIEQNFVEKLVYGILNATFTDRWPKNYSCKIRVLFYQELSPTTI